MGLLEVENVDDVVSERRLHRGIRDAVNGVVECSKRRKLVKSEKGLAEGTQKPESFGKIRPSDKCVSFDNVSNIF